MKERGVSNEVMSDRDEEGSSREENCMNVDSVRRTGGGSVLVCHHFPSLFLFLFSSAVIFLQSR